MELFTETQTALKFISRIQVGEKINVQQMAVNPASWWSSLIRTWWFADNRNKTLAFVHESVNRALELIHCYDLNPTPYTKILRRNLICDLNATKNGLENLKATYEGDLKFQCQVETILQNIEASLLTIKYQPCEDYTSD